MAKIILDDEFSYESLAKHLATEQGLTLIKEKGQIILEGSKIRIPRKDVNKFIGLQQVPETIANRLWRQGMFAYTGRLTKMTDEEMIISDLPEGPTSMRLKQESGDILDEIYLYHNQKKTKTEIMHEALLLYMNKYVLDDN